MTKQKLFTELHRIILIRDVDKKCAATQKLNGQPIHNFEIAHEEIIAPITTPGLPQKLELVAPRNLKRRGIKSQQGRNILMHAIAHIEFNAINLALDAAYRFRNQPIQYYQDWIQIAAEEARHFILIRDYLRQNNCEYSDFPVHNGLWDMAVKTAGDVVARMALVPRVLEARGLDVTPGIIKRLHSANDNSAVAILKVIYQEEIDHVRVGSKWFNYQCELNHLKPKSTFKSMIDKHLHGELKGPFNIAARLQAGFDELELESLKSN